MAKHKNQPDDTTVEVVHDHIRIEQVGNLIFLTKPEARWLAARLLAFAGEEAHG